MKHKDLRSSLRLLITRTNADIGTDPVQFPINGDLTTVLCVPGPPNDVRKSAMVVPIHVCERWDLAEGELWELALSNMGRDKVNRQTFDTDHGPLHSVNGMGWPGAAQVFRLADILGAPLPYGCLVTLPSNNAFCAVPVSRRSMNIVPFLMELTAGLSNDDPAPMPPALFWLYRATLEEIKLTDVGGATRMDVPDRFMEVFQTIS